MGFLQALTFLAWVVLIVSSKDMEESCKNGFCEDMPDCQQVNCRCNYPSKTDCAQYYQCVNGEPVQYKCSPGLLFNSEKLACDYSGNVNCSISYSTTVSNDYTSGSTKYPSSNSTVTSKEVTVTETSSTGKTEISTETTTKSHEKEKSDSVTPTLNATVTKQETASQNKTTSNAVDESTEQTFSIRNESVTTTDLVSTNKTTSSSVNGDSDHTEITTSSTLVSNSSKTAITFGDNNTEWTGKTLASSEMPNPSEANTLETIFETYETKLTTTKYGTKISTDDIISNNPDATTTSAEASVKTTSNSERESTIQTDATTNTSSEIDNTNTTHTTKSNATKLSTKTPVNTEYPITTEVNSTETKFKTSEDEWTTKKYGTSISNDDIISTDPDIIITNTANSSAGTILISENKSTMQTDVTAEFDNSKPTYSTKSDGRELDTKTSFSTKFPVTPEVKFTNTESEITNTVYSTSDYGTSMKTERPLTTKISSTMISEQPTSNDGGTELSQTEDLTSGSRFITSSTSKVGTTSDNTKEIIGVKSSILPVTDQTFSSVMDYTKETEIPVVSSEKTTFTDESTIKSSTMTSIDFKCPERFGLYPDIKSCYRFYQCSHWIPYAMECPSKLHFNPELTVCDWPDRAGCDEQASTLDDSGNNYSTKVSPEGMETKTSQNPTGTRIVDTTTMYSDSPSTEEENIKSTTSKKEKVPEATEITISIKLSTTETEPTSTSVTIIPQNETAETEATSTSTMYSASLSTEEENIKSTTSKKEKVSKASKSTISIKLSTTETEPTSASVTTISQNETTETEATSTSVTVIPEIATSETEPASTFVTVIPEIATSESEPASTSVTAISENETTGTETTTSVNITSKIATTETEATSTSVTVIHENVTEIQTLSPETVTTTHVDSSSTEYYTTNKFIKTEKPETLNTTLTSYVSNKNEITTTLFPGTKLDLKTTELTKNTDSKITTDLPPIAFSCPERFGLFPDPTSCFRFYHCSNGISYLKVCPSKLHFNPILTVCDWPSEAGCVLPSTQTPPGSYGESCKKCSRCSIPNENDCSAYVYCLNGVPHNLRCPRNFLFNRNTGRCDDSDDVYCPDLTSDECPKLYGIFPADDCSQFIHCSKGIPYTKDCPPGLHFNAHSLVCDWPENVDCGVSSDSQLAVSVMNAQMLNETCNCKNCLVPDERNCARYFLCQDGMLFLGQCSKGLLFNPVIQNCDLEERVKCSGNTPICREPGEILPNAEDCASFYKCNDGVPYLEYCEGNLHFNAESHECVAKCKAKCDKTIDCSSMTTVESTMTDTLSSKTLLCPDPLGMYPVKGDCSSFYQCYEAKPYFAVCPDGLHFNAEYNVCENPCDAKCDPNIDCSSGRLETAKAFRVLNINPRTFQQYKEAEF